jgi:hypothetical protein
MTQSFSGRTLIEAKIGHYDMDVLVREYARVADAARGKSVDPEAAFSVAPKTFVEPGVDGQHLSQELLPVAFAPIDRPSKQPRT